MKLRKLKNIFVGESDEVSADKNETEFSELIQFLDDRSLALVIREAKDDGRKAFKILREFYAGDSKPRVITLYSQLTTLQKGNTENITDYLMRAKKAAMSLQSAKEQISDSTARMESVRILTQLAVQNDWMMHQMDVKGAYLHAPIECDVYVEQPDGFKVNGDKLVWKLNKSLYGLKQSGRNWNCLLQEFLSELNFKQSSADPCVFYKTEKSETVILLVWVDDIIIEKNFTIIAVYQLYLGKL